MRDESGEPSFGKKFGRILIRNVDQKLDGHEAPDFAHPLETREMHLSHSPLPQTTNQSVAIQVLWQHVSLPYPRALA
jgi:hypothetical protein